MLITNARVRGYDTLVDIQIDDGWITSVTPAGTGMVAGTPGTSADSTSTHTSSPANSEVLDAAGRLVTPPFVDSHLHLDYANTVGQPRQNESGTLFEGITIWGEHKAAGYVNPETVYANALAAVRSEVSKGVGFIRTHVDITEPGFVALEAIQQLKADVADWVDIRITAFPQNSVFGFPGGEALLKKAAGSGVDAVGGIPHLETSRELGVRQLGLVFDLAEEHDLLVDVHCDEIDDPASRFLEVMAAESAKRGMQGRVSASHLVAAAYYPASYLDRLLPQVAAAGISAAVNPTENLHLQGRNWAGPTPRGIAPVAKFLEACIAVGLGQDSIADPWYPIGEGDLLRVLETGLMAFHMLQPRYLDSALDLITMGGAKNLALKDYGIASGNRADLIMLDATSDHDAVQHQADVLLNIHRGTVVFEARPRMWVRALPGFAG